MCKIASRHCVSASKTWQWVLTVLVKLAFSHGFAKSYFQHFNPQPLLTSPCFRWRQ